MRDQLLQMRDRLQEERQELARRLKEIDDNLASVEKVISLVASQGATSVQLQLDPIRREKDTDRFANLTFKESVLQILNEKPDKFWAPREIASELLNNGFTTKAKKFGPTARTMLHVMRESGVVNATKTKTGWLYGPLREKKERLYSSTGEELIEAEVK